MAIVYQPAWEVVGYTKDGEPYCKHCAPKGEDVGVIFAVDLADFGSWFCDNCKNEIK
jgi:hypothetical protein